MATRTIDVLAGQSKLVPSSPFYFFEAQVGIPLTKEQNRATEVASLMVIVFRFITNINEFFSDEIKDKEKRLVLNFIFVLLITQFYSAVL